jgi:hypothetical protein
MEGMKLHRQNRCCVTCITLAQSQVVTLFPRAATEHILRVEEKKKGGCRKIQRWRWGRKWFKVGRVCTNTCSSSSGVGDCARGVKRRGRNQKMREDIGLEKAQ